MWEVNGINLLVDPVFGTVDFGVPLLVQAKKQVREPPCGDYGSAYGVVIWERVLFLAYSFEVARDKTKTICPLLKGNGGYFHRKRGV